MRASLLAMLGFAALMVALALWRGEGTLELGLRNAATQGGRFLPILAVAFVLMGLTEALLPPELVQTWLSDAAGWRGIVVAWVAGALTPGGSLVGMPLAYGLFRAGVSPSVLITYLTSLALLSVIRLPIELSLLGPRLTALRVAASVLLPPLAGFLVRIAEVSLGPPR